MAIASRIIANPSAGTLATALLSLTLLAGCAANFNNPAPATTPLSPLTGKVHGGQQPVTGAQVFLYAAGTSGYGTPARSMLAAPGYTTTDSTGAFSITGAYTCQPGDQVYLLATGGNPGLAPGTSNPALALMAALGPCSALTPSTFINIDEVTTVAAAYALAGFMDSPTTLSSSGSALALVGATNAFLNAANLANPTTGTPNPTTAGGNGTVPAAEINTLANILAACVNSTGSTAPCTTLFTAATPTGGTAPTDTAQAILNLAHNPGLHVATLFALATPTAPFQPTLPTAPHDWSLAITYTGALSRPSNTSPQISVDGLGNIWVFSGGEGGLGVISPLEPTGTPFSPGGYTAGLIPEQQFMSGFALDSANNAWISVLGVPGPQNFVLKLNSSGVTLSPPGGYSGGGLSRLLSDTASLAFDSAGNLWIEAESYYGPAVFNGSTGAPLSLSSYLTNGGYEGLQFASTVFATPQATVWVAGLEATNSGALLLGPSQTLSFAYQSDSTTALDAAGNIWGSGLYEWNSSGILISPAAGYPSGLENSVGPNNASLVTDGLNRLWYLNPYKNGEVGVVDDSGNLLSPQGGYQMENDPAAGCLYNDIDPSGNMWLATFDGSVVEFVGIAAPVVRPLATAVATNTIGVRP